MAESYLRQRALDHRALEGRAREAAPGARPGVQLWLQGPRARLALRGDARSSAFAAGVEVALGMPLPTEANTARTGADVSVLWLGPDEWLVDAADGRQLELVSALEAALEGEHFLATDVSHGRCVLGLQGPRAREVLMKGCSLDLHPRTFGAGRCAQSALARAHMLLHQLDEAPRYHVYVQRSFADYAFAWLEDAAAEFGLVIGAP